MKSEIKKEKERLKGKESINTINTILFPKLAANIHDNAFLNLKTTFQPHPLIKLGELPSLFYSPSFISADMSQFLQSSIEHEGNTHPNTWKILRTRRLQCWEATSTTPLPGFLCCLTDYLLDKAVLDANTYIPNHILINQYQRGQGILHHTDGPKYINYVAILSLGSSCLMTFRKRLHASQIGVEYEGDLFSILLQPLSLLVFSDDIYSEYMHGIHDVESEVVGANGVACLNKELAGVSDGDVIERDDRLSLTIRHLISPESG